jgi:hypothetical protein
MFAANIAKITASRAVLQTLERRKTRRQKTTGIGILLWIASCHMICLGEKQATTDKRKDSQVSGSWVGQGPGEGEK